MEGIDHKLLGKPGPLANDQEAIFDGMRGRIAATAGAPLYEVVKRYIYEAIMVGDWGPGTVLPSETSMAQSLGVAVGTVRRALTDLTREGLLARRRKTGTVVTGRTPHHSLRSFYQYFRLHSRSGSFVRSTSRVLAALTAAATAEEAEKFGLAQGEHVVRIHRLRLVEGRPIMNQRLVMPCRRVPDFPLSPAELPGLTYAYLLERYGIRMLVVREAVTAELATEEDRRLLELPDPTAVLCIEDVSFNQFGEPVQLNIQRCSTADHAYMNEIS